MVLPLVSVDTSLLLGVFPNSSFAGPWNLSLLLISWLWSPLELMTESR